MIQTLILSFLTLALLNTPTNSQLIFNFCETSSNYTTNSTYETNLNNLFNSLTKNTSKTGFSTSTEGEPPYQVFGLAICRGDMNDNFCNGCVTMASRYFTQICPYNKGAIAWYDRCIVRYSNHNFFSQLDDGIPEENICLDQSASDPYQFKQKIVTMMESLAHIAAFNRSVHMFATGAGTGLYGLVQCTRDLSGDQCYNCLNQNLHDLSADDQCDESVQVTALRGSCIVMSDMKQFFSSDPTWVAPPDPDPTIIPPVKPPPLSETQRGNGHKTSTIALGVGLPLVFLAAVIIFICLRRKNRFNKNRIPVNVKSRNSLLIKFSTLQQATDNFSDSNKLGEGGFGPVYKGKMPNGQEIAVKRLATGSDQGLSELENEVQFLAELQHKNLVRLFGVCIEEKEMLLVYEYIRNKSLDTLIFENSSGRKLNWEHRLKIIKGISRGLLYIHQDSAIRLVHRDLKASNILLDENMNPKISDFGLARLLGGDHTQSKTSKVVGTYGYMAPEYAVHGTISTKADIFSFGVLILEIIAGRSNSSFSGSSEGNILNYAWEHWTNGTAIEMKDPCLDPDPNTDLEVMRCINVALLCAQQRPNERPNIYSVNLMLTRNRMQIPPPSNPAFVMVNSSVEDRDIEASYNSTTTNTYSVKYSINEVSCTEPYPR
ncbi:cysteine-rich RECEPTOR-like kinase [Rhynchospora pubera]|uniref:Cysteine-rich RECEPTOR-like kinase n=1 Tax=Rhynchospora pubera TaxID=906938 RepID=A0AAV8GEH4_9POAL|nr:cysteine-rich RECEPTOR-like kinase [Rhynchospora pubera]